MDQDQSDPVRCIGKKYDFKRAQRVLVVPDVMFSTRALCVLSSCQPLKLSIKRIVLEKTLECIVYVWMTQC